MARTTLKSLAAENEALRSEISTLRTLLQSARSDVAERDERITALERRAAQQPARGRVITRREPTAMEVAYKEYTAAQREIAITEQRSVSVLCFAAWAAQQQEAA